MDLRNIDNRTLKFLSVSPHPAFGGDTRVNGVIAIEGPKNDKLKSLELRVIENGRQVAVARLAPTAKHLLEDKRFGPSGIIKISVSQLLFSLASTDMGAINQTTDGTLTLFAVAQSEAGDMASKPYSPVAKLVRYTGNNRYGPPDLGIGGDDWILPSVKPVLEHFAPTLVYGDMSKMNGGSFFPPHHTHDAGYDVDIKYADGSYSAHTAKSAQRMLQLLDDPWGSRVGTVYVQFTKLPSDGFWTTISNAQLTDGRHACRVFRNPPPHEGHFHWRIDHQDASGSC